MFINRAAAALALALMAAPGLAQTAQQWKCTGNPDYPWDDQIVGCTSAISSGNYMGRNLALVLSNRGSAYTAKKDYDRAIADYNQAIQLNPNNAAALYWRGKAKQLKGDITDGDADIATARKINPNVGD
jgi:tetratricopeptide (TPR) repeat protein